jgi:glycosidase
MDPWPPAPRLYELNTRVWLLELSARYGTPPTLDQVPDEALETIASYGFDAVWLMGVWTTGTAARAEARQPARMAEWRRALHDASERDVPGSPYAISAYEVPAALGGDGALQSLRERLARLRLRLVLDFVPNHTAVDHPLTRSRPEAFVRGTDDDLRRDPASFFRTSGGAILAHGRDPYFPAWTDTAQVNHGHGEGRAALRDALVQVADRCDGVRCDMAMLLLPDVIERVWGSRLGDAWIRDSFWAETIPQVRARHADFLFLAEAYWGLEPRLQAEGFDFTYDKALYDRLREDDVDGVRRHVSRPLGAQRRDARFLENHDEPRAAATFGARAKVAALVTYLGPGLKLFHEGQMEGWKVKLPVQLDRRPEEPADAATHAFYRQLLEILREPAFADGSFFLADMAGAGPADTSHEQMIGFLRQAPYRAGCDLGWLVVANLGARTAYARIRLPLPFEPRGSYRFDDRLNRAIYDRPGAELLEAGLFVALEPYAAHVFCVQAR